MSTSARSNDLSEDNTCKKLSLKLLKLFTTVYFELTVICTTLFPKIGQIFFALNMDSGYI